MEHFRYKQYLAEKEHLEELDRKFDVRVLTLFHDIMMAYCLNMKNGYTHEALMEHYQERLAHFDKKTQRSGHTTYRVSYSAYEKVLSVFKSKEEAYKLHHTFDHSAITSSVTRYDN